MKRIHTLAVCLLATLPTSMMPLSAQADKEKAVNNQDVSTIDLKLDLAETKLELLDSRIRLWEDKPAALERDLREIELQISQLSFTPEQFNEKFMLLDSMLIQQQMMMTEQQAMLDRIEENQDGVSFATEDRDSAAPASSPDHAYITDLTEGPDHSEIPQSKYVISIYPIRIFEGTMQLSLEWILNRGNAIELSGMATYAAREGVANYYLANQKLDYYNASMDAYVPYESENISGFGTALAWRNYLLPRTRPEYTAPRGVYAAPSVMYRRLTLSGFDFVWNEETGNSEQVEVEQVLNVISGGVMAGWQFVLWNAVTADVYVGGMIRLSKYEGEDNFTKYKQVRNIDFSGVMPTFGLKIGIVK